MKYKPLLLAPLGLIPAGIPVADAADMPVKVQPVQPARFMPLWTGFYAGVNVGVLSARSELNAFLPSSAVPAENNYCWLGRTGDCTFNNSSTATGVLGGIQIGYNFQSANIVYGAEVDFGGSSAKKSFGGTNPVSGYSYAAETGIEAMGTARAAGLCLRQQCDGLCDRRSGLRQSAGFVPAPFSSRSRQRNVFMDQHGLARRLDGGWRT